MREYRSSLVWLYAVLPAVLFLVHPVIVGAVSAILLPLAWSERRRGFTWPAVVLGVCAVLFLLLPLMMTATRA